VNPGRISGVAKISPLKRLSPSRFLAVKGCALREVWAADRAPTLLPSSPRAKLGTVIHSLLELAGNGQLGRSPEGQIDQTWTRLVSECEAQMGKSWLERSLVPLSKTVPDFEVRRLRARRIALQMAAATISFVATSPEARGIGFEVWVETADHLVGGKIDEMRLSADGLKLRDYKTGQILDADVPEGIATVKTDYQTQLRLYAALYNCKFGEWPSRLEVVDLDGREFEVPFDIASCEGLLEEAYKVLDAVNKKIQASRSTEETVNMLATPSPSNCVACVYRPGCQAYRTARQESSLTGWPTDIFGILQYVRKLAGGRVSLGISMPTGANTLTRVRNLESAESRNPALKFLKEGDLVGIFNLRGDQQGSDFSESSMTAVYSLESA
jgi:hypothetical protein